SARSYSASHRARRSSASCARRSSPVFISSSSSCSSFCNHPSPFPSDDVASATGSTSSVPAAAGSSPRPDPPASSAPTPPPARPPPQPPAYPPPPPVRLLPGADYVNATVCAPPPSSSGRRSSAQVSALLAAPVSCVSAAPVTSRPAQPVPPLRSAAFAASPTGFEPAPRCKSAAYPPSRSAVDGVRDKGIANRTPGSGCGAASRDADPTELPGGARSCGSAPYVPICARRTGFHASFWRDVLYCDREHESAA